jgi:outer membrane autotransporter protein
VQSSLVFLDPVLEYTATTVELALQRNDISFDSIAKTPNQHAVAGAVDQLDKSHPVYDALAVLDVPQALDAFDQLSGELHASLRTALFDDSRYVRDAVNGRLLPAWDREVEPGDGLWASGWKHWTRHDSDGNAARMEGDGSGLLAGADFGIGAGRLGVMIGFGDGTQRVDDRASRARLDTTHFGIYGSHGWGAYSVRGGLAYAWQTVRSTRSIDFGDLQGMASADYGAHTAQAFVEADRAWQLRPQTVVAPFLGLAQVQTRTAAFTEKGTVAALQVAAVTDHVTVSRLGARLQHQPQARTLSLEAALSWAHAWQDVDKGQHRFIGGPAPFLIAGVPLAEDAAGLDLDLRWQMPRGWTLGLGYRGQFADGYRDQSASATVMVSF